MLLVISCGKNSKLQMTLQNDCPHDLTNVEIRFNGGTYKIDSLVKGGATTFDLLNIEQGKVLILTNYSTPKCQDSFL